MAVAQTAIVHLFRTYDIASFSLLLFESNGSHFLFCLPIANILRTSLNLTAFNALRFVSESCLPLIYGYKMIVTLHHIVQQLWPPWIDLLSPDHHSVLKVGDAISHWCLKCGSAVPRQHNWHIALLFQKR